MRPLVYYIASSLDGFIAREDGSFEDFPWDDDFVAHLRTTYPETFPATLRDASATRADNRRFDTVLMGRKTYEVGQREGLTSPYPTLDQFVFSRTLTESPDPAVQLVSEDAISFVIQLKKQDGEAIWICGGSELATLLYAAGLIDEVIVKLNPVLFGTGIPLLAGRQESARLRLDSCEPHTSGHVVLTYAVQNRAVGVNSS